MLNSLWNRISRRNWSAEGKFRLFRLALEVPAGLAGLLLWLIVRIWCLKTWDWMVCFVGYPVILAWLVTVLFSCRRDL